jgi:hypothetical protein
MQFDLGITWIDNAMRRCAGSAWSELIFTSFIGPTKPTALSARARAQANYPATAARLTRRFGVIRIPQFFKTWRLDLPFIPKLPHSMRELPRLLFVIDPFAK